jgi:hypothetical protein
LNGKGRPEQPGGLLHCFSAPWVQKREFLMPISTIVIIVLILVLIGAVPAWPHSRSWGYGPSGIVGVVLAVVLVLLLMGRL